jgi:PAS domain S-box-containing protein
LKCGASLPTNKKTSKAKVGEQTIAKGEQVEESLKQSEEKYHQLFSSMTEMFQVIELIYDENGKAFDYYYRDVNSAFEKLVGKTRVQIVDKRVKDLFGIVEDYWIKVYAEVAKTGEPLHFENYGAELDKWYEIYAWKTNDAQVAIIFTDVTERKKVEEALRFSEAHYRTLFSSIGEGFELMELIFDENKAVCDLRYLEVNDTYEKQTGLKAKDVVGKTVRELFPKIEGMWIEVFDKVIKTGLPTRLEDYHQDTGRYYSTFYFPFGKKEVGVLFSDVTERKKAEEKVNQSMKTFLELIERAPFGIYVINSEFCIAHMNKGSQNGAFRNVRPLIGRDFSEAMHILWPEPTASEIISHFRHTLETGEPYYSPQFINPRHDVEIVESYEWELQRIWLPDGQYGVICYYFDSTKLRETERVLYEAQAKLKEYSANLERLVEERTKKLELSSLYARNLIEASLDPLVTINVDGKITDVNKATELATGCSRKELIGSDFSFYFAEPEKAEVGYKRVFAEGVVKDYPLAIKQKTGRIVDVLYNATVYRNDAGNVQGVFAAARDITEQKKAEAQVQEAAKKLKDSERLAAIGATAGMVGHDIRNPLQAITSDLFLIKSELSELPDNENKTNAIESLDEIQNNIDYINKIVADLQDFARPLNPLAQETDVESIFNEILGKNDIPKNIRVSVDIDDKARKIMADPNYLKRIASNLTLNAVQAMPDGGKLTIHAYVDKATNDVLITVKDTGVGIPEDIKPKLFTPMMTTKSKGQGFGLAVVKRMTEALGGTVVFESTEGKGTTFIVRLPPQELNRKWTYK